MIHICDNRALITSFKLPHICGLNSSPTSLTIYLLKKEIVERNEGQKIKQLREMIDWKVYRGLIREPKHQELWMGRCSYSNAKEEKFRGFERRKVKWNVMVVGVVWVCGVKTRVMRRKKGCENRWESVLWSNLMETSHDRGSHTIAKIYKNATISQFP